MIAIVYKCNICLHEISDMSASVALMGGRTGVDGPIQRSYETFKGTTHTHLCRKCCRAIIEAFKPIDDPIFDKTKA